MEHSSLRVVRRYCEFPSPGVLYALKARPLYLLPVRCTRGPRLVYFAARRQKYHRENHQPRDRPGRGGPPRVPYRRSYRRAAEKRLLVFAAAIIHVHLSRDGRRWLSGGGLSSRDMLPTSSLKPQASLLCLEADHA